MNEYKWIDVVGGIDPALVEDAAAEDLLPYEKERKSRRTPSLKVFRRAAIFALAAIVIACGMLMLDENVRAAVFMAFTHSDKYGVSVHFEGPGTGTRDVEDVEIGYIPEGLTEVEKNTDSIPNVRRVIYLENLENEKGKKDIFSPFVEIRIGYSGEFEPGFSNETYETYVYKSTVNGMEAFMIDFSAPLNGKTFVLSSIVFGDGDITVSMYGYLDIKELTKIAESITWW